MDAIAAALGFSSFGGGASRKGRSRKRKRSEQFPPPPALFTRYEGTQATPSSKATRACHSSSAYLEGSYAHGVKFSPDDTRVLTCDENGVMFVFEASGDGGEHGVGGKEGEEEEEKSDLDGGKKGEARSREPRRTTSSLACLVKADVADFVYSYQWYPYMQSSCPATSCFATTSRAHPVQLWDATRSNKLRATYRCVNEKEELDSAASVCFAPSGTRILAGCERVVRVFDVSRPGAQVSDLWTSPTRRDRSPCSQKGIISALAFCGSHGLDAGSSCSEIFAAGSYSGTVFVYSEKIAKPVVVLGGGDSPKSVRVHAKGVTQVQFAPLGSGVPLLFSGGRKEENGGILCWDLRNPGSPVQSFPRKAVTNQRIGFDLDPSGSILATGSSGGVLLYDVKTGTRLAELETESRGNDASFASDGRLAVALGERCYDGGSESENDDGDNDSESENNGILVFGTM